jgi:hypothetical protein
MERKIAVMGRSIPNNVISNQDESSCVQSREEQEQKRQQLSSMFSPALCPPRYAQADLLLPGLYGITGNVVEMAVAAGVQTGWPQPLLLTPIINPVCVTMSYTILSGRVASVFTPAGT